MNDQCQTAPELEIQVVGRERSSAASPKELRSEGNVSGRRRQLVLVVDDEPIIAETLLEILRHEGFDAHSASDGLEAVEKASDLKPDIVLADVAMPRLNGIEAAKRIMASLPRTRVVLFSGQAESADLLMRAREQGYEFEVLAKPIKPDQLLRTLRQKD